MKQTVSINILVFYRENIELYNKFTFLRRLRMNTETYIEQGKSY